MVHVVTVMRLPHLHGFNVKFRLYYGLHSIGMNESRCKGVTPVHINGVRQGCPLSSWIGRYRYNCNRSEEALYNIIIAVQPGLTVSTLNCLVVVYNVYSVVEVIRFLTSVLTFKVIHALV